MSAKHTSRVCWNIQLTLESILLEPELSQVHEVAELLGQLSCEKVETSANTQRMYAGTYKLALELIVGQPEVGQFDEVAELLGQLSCKKVEMPAQPYNACMLEHTNSPRN